MLENIKVFTQNSVRLTVGDKRVYIDPFQMTEEPRDADLILLTHDHHDHFSRSDIRKVAKADTVFVAPQGMADQVPGKTVAVTPGQSYQVEGVSIETVAAYNQSKPFHPQSARWVGYVVTVAGKRIYVAGDTDATPEARAVRCDVALVPVGGTYTMDAKQAAQLVNALRPEYAVPVHYGTIVGDKEDGERFAALVEPPVQVELLLGR